MKQSRGRAILGSAVLAGAIGIAGFAFTASNTVPDTKAGDGEKAVTGYAVTNVHYVLDGTNPTKANAVKFTLDSAPTSGGTFKAQLDSTGGWYDCAVDVIVPTNATCATTSPQLLVKPIDTLHIVIAQ
jgi:hypothetical protein